MVPQSEHWKYAGVKPQWTQDWENMPMGKVGDLKGDAYNEYMDYEGHHDHTEWVEEQRREQEAAQAAEQSKKDTWDALIAEAEELGIPSDDWYITESSPDNLDDLQRRVDDVKRTQGTRRGRTNRRGRNFRRGEPMDMAWGLLKHA